VTVDRQQWALLAVAAACWAGAGSASWAAHAGGPWSWPGLLSGLALALVAALMASVVWPAVRTWALPLAGFCAGAAAAVAMHAGPGAPPIDAWITSHVTADVVGVVSSEPRAVRGYGGEPGREIRLATSRISARGTAVDFDTTVLVRLPEGPIPVPGTEVRVRGRLGPARALGQATAQVSAVSLAILAEPGPVDRWAGSVRSGLRKAVEGLAPDSGALVAGLAVGDESMQPPELADDMRRAGLSHLTAVSGGNVGSVLAVAVGACALLRLGLVARTGVACGVLACFTVLVGAQPSVLRAVAMAAIAALGALSGGRRAGASVLSVAVLVLLISSPWLATSWGFALSTAATAGLILLSPLLDGWLSRAVVSRDLPRSVREALALTSAAQLATLPLLVAMGGAIGWAALPANLMAMPAVPAVTLLGVAAGLASPILPGAAAALAWCAGWPAGWIATVSRVCSDLPGPQVPWPSGWVGALAIGAGVAGVGAGLLLGRRPWPRNSGRWALAVALAGSVVLTIRPPLRHGWPPPDWLMLMCDVGQGDAVLLRSGPDAAVLVDAGPDARVLDRCLDDAGIATLQAVVLTHFHADHVGGLEGAYSQRAVGPVLTSPVREPSGEVDAVAKVLSRHGSSMQAIGAGDRRVIGDVSWEALWPRRRIAAGSVPNNASIVLVADVRGHRLLLSGDVETEAQIAVAADLRRFAFSVVKVPHHGSSHVSAALPMWASAPLALISVGEGNDYGHPAESTVAGWQAAGATVLRTDEAGDIAVVATGDGSVGVVTHGRVP
jgi:competence protein ComEC